MHIRAIGLLTLITLLAAITPAAIAAPPGCPHDANADGRIDIEDLYHLNQNPTDINGDGVANADDIACLEWYLRCVERLDMSSRPGEPAADGLVPSASYRQTAVMGGLTQTLAVRRTPSPDGASCISQTWTTTLLGTRTGLSGPVEIRLDRDGFLWQPLFVDAASTSPGTTARRGVLTCEDSAIEFVAATSAMTVRSSNESRALVLLDGQNVTAMAVAKGVADAANRMIGGGLVAGYVDVDGNVSLPTRGMLVLYELDPGTASDPSFAFDDAALLVDVECGDIADTTPQLIVLKDSIGPDNALTNLRWILQTTEGGGAYEFIPALLQASTPTTLKSVSIVLAQAGQYPITWEYYDYHVRIWSSEASVLQSRLRGDVLNCYFRRPSNVPNGQWDPPEFGLGKKVFSNILNPSYLAEFDLSACPVTLNPGVDYYITVAPRRFNGNMTDGILGIVDSAHAPELPSEWYYASPFPPPDNRRLVRDLPLSPPANGRLPIRVIGEQ